MRYRQLGSSGPNVSVIGLGASHFGRVCDLAQTRAIVDAAVVATSIQRTLQRLQTDYLDLYLLHMPDPSTPFDETLEALDELVHSGVIRCVGASNLDAAQIVAAQCSARRRQLSPLACVQYRYNLLERQIERDILPVCQRYGLALVPASPLAAGLLSGRHRRGQLIPVGTRLAAKYKAIDDATFDRLEYLERGAHERGITLLELAIGWLVAQPCVGPVINGATTPEQIRANAAAADWLPSPEDLVTMNTLVMGTVPC